MKVLNFLSELDFETRRNLKVSLVERENPCSLQLSCEFLWTNYFVCATESKFIRHLYRLPQPFSSSVHCIFVIFKLSEERVPRIICFWVGMIFGEENLRAERKLGASSHSTCEMKNWLNWWVSFGLVSFESYWFVHIPLNLDHIDLSLPPRRPYMRP